jgi:hypothetical protein
MRVSLVESQGPPQEFISTAAEKSSPWFRDTEASSIVHLVKQEWLWVRLEKDIHERGKVEVLKDALNNLPRVVQRIYADKHVVKGLS